jgi:NADH:ubiquinone oxidoreductase subunit C
MTDWSDLPGFVAVREAHGETTVTIETEHIRDACLHARNELGFGMCVDLVATDYLRRARSARRDDGDDRDPAHP